MSRRYAAPVAALALLLLATGHLSAQEVRAGAAFVSPSIRGVPNSFGEGVGVRWFYEGLGLGVDYDRFSASNRFQETVCGESREGPVCEQDQVDFDSEMDLLTLLLLAEIYRTEDWRVRLMIGRTAGTIRGEGVGLETGFPADATPADFDRGIHWSRGADGSVLAMELLWALPLPRVPLYARAALRSHRIEMRGCETGTYSPFCGNLMATEVQLGAVVLLRRPGGAAGR